MSRRPSNELFPTDEPVKGDELIGRAADVEEIATSLTAGVNLVLAAPRRTGKTSTCGAALERVRDDGLYVVTVDLFKVPNSAGLAEALVAGCLSNRPTLMRVIGTARRIGRNALEKVQLDAVLRAQGELGDDMEIVLTPGFAKRDPDRYLDYALELPNRIAKADGKRLVLFFDEFQEIAGGKEPFGDPDRLTKQMRATFQQADAVTLMFAGSIEHLMKDLFSPEGGALSRFGRLHQLRPIDAGTWRSGLRERLARDECEIDDDAVERLIEFGDLHPRATMLIAQQAHLLSILLGTRKLHVRHVQQGFEEAVLGDRLHHEQLVERLRQLRRQDFEIALSIAAGDETLWAELPPSSVQRALTDFSRMGIAERQARGHWQIIDPLFRHYLRQLHQL